MARVQSISTATLLGWYWAYCGALAAVILWSTWGIPAGLALTALLFPLGLASTVTVYAVLTRVHAGMPVESPLAGDSEGRVVVDTRIRWARVVLASIAMFVAIAGNFMLTEVFGSLLSPVLVGASAVQLTFAGVVAVFLILGWESPGKESR